MGKILEFKPKDEDDLIIFSDDKITFRADSLIAKNNILSCLDRAQEKWRLIDKEGYTCGSCAAYPCFRCLEGDEERVAGLCYQEIRLCRDECDYFRKDKESRGNSCCQITGECKKDKSIVNYEDECRFID